MLDDFISFVWSSVVCRANSLTTNASGFSCDVRDEGLICRTTCLTGFSSGDFYTNVLNEDTLCQSDMDNWPKGFVRCSQSTLFLSRIFWGFPRANFIARTFFARLLLQVSLLQRFWTNKSKKNTPGSLWAERGELLQRALCGEVIFKRMTH